LGQKETRTLVDVLNHLEAVYGHKKDTSKQDLVDEFNSRRYEPRKESLNDWIARKLWLMEQCPEDFDSDAAKNRAMKRILLSRMPESYGPSVMMIEGQRFANWSSIVSHLNDWEARNCKKKTEPSGSSFVAEPTSTDSTKSGKGAKHDKGAVFKSMLKTGDFTGLTLSQAHAFMTDRAERQAAKAEKRATTAAASAYQTGKGAGKAGKMPQRDKSGDTCNNCGEKAIGRQSAPKSGIPCK
jgi:hypothetical protein